MSPNRPCTLAIRQATSRLCRKTDTHRVLQLKPAFRRAASSLHTKTDHVLAVLKYAEPTLSKFPLHSQRTNIFADLFAAGNLLSEQPKADRARVVVFGISDTSAVEDLVSLLLDDPLASTDALGNYVRSRWEGISDNSQSFQYDPILKRTLGGALLPSPWLAQIPMKLIEVRAASPELVHSADIPILVVDPFFSNSLSFLEDVVASLPPNPNSILLVNAPVGPSTAARLDSQIRSSFLNAERGEETIPRVVFVDIERASLALDILRVDPTSAAEIQRYQTDFIASGIPKVVSVVQGILEDGLEPVRERTLQVLGTSVMSRGRWAVKKARKDAGRTHGTVSDIRGLLIEEEEKIKSDVLGSSEGGVPLISTAVERAAKDVRVVMDSFSWWKLPIVSDDLSRSLNDAVSRAYTEKLENQLVFHSGRLAGKQKNLSEVTENRLSIVPRLFQSSLLKNTLAQISSSPSYPVLASSLLGPLHSRIAQLVFPTSRLHLSAQRAVVTALGGTFVSAGGSFALWATSFLDGATAAGIGALATVTVLRWAIYRWDRARRRWWKDWARVGEGLDRDVRYSLDEVIQNQVFAVPRKACNGLEELISERRKELDAMEDELQRLNARMKGSQDGS